jgi:dihydrofolate reductase
MIISIISAVSENDVIGKDNDLPWHLPADLQHFKRLTAGHSVIMGRKTFESVGKPLPNRTNIVITRQQDYVANGCILASSLGNALEEVPQGEKEVFICGGSEIYKLGLQLADRLYITRIHAQFEGDIFFPSIDRNIWKEVARENHVEDDKNSFPYSYITYLRIT